MLQKKKVVKLLSTITLSSTLLLSATVVTSNEQANVVLSLHTMLMSITTKANVLEVLNHSKKANM